MQLRYEVRTSDLQSVREVTNSSGFFHDYEVDVAVELVEERLERGNESGYFFVLLDDDEGRLIGYTCYGEIGITRQRYDVYWIATRNTERGKGYGKILLKETENKIAAAGGEILYLETSSKDLYLPTRSFYEKVGYYKEATILDFYDNGDSKVIYSKRLNR